MVNWAPGGKSSYVEVLEMGIISNSLGVQVKHVNRNRLWTWKLLLLMLLLLMLLLILLQQHDDDLNIYNSTPNGNHNRKCERHDQNL